MSVPATEPARYNPWSLSPLLPFPPAPSSICVARLQTAFQEWIVGLISPTDSTVGLDLEPKVCVGLDSAQALGDWVVARGDRPTKRVRPKTRGSVSGTWVSDQVVFKLLNKRWKQSRLV